MAELPQIVPNLAETYKFADASERTVIRGSDGAVIPIGQATELSRQYDKWRQFNIPTPADPVPVLAVDNTIAVDAVQYPADTLDAIIGLLLLDRPITTADIPTAVLSAYTARTAILTQMKG